MKSIKTKLILGLSALIVVLFSLAAFLLIDEKSRELSRDMYTRARAVTELSTPRVVDLYKSLLAEESFVLFNREIKDVLNKDEDIKNIKIYIFAGEVLYDSAEENVRRYEGQERTVKKSAYIERIKAALPSYLLEDGRVVYLKKEHEGTYRAVDAQEHEILGIEDGDRIVDIIFPYQGAFAVQYDLTYENLQSRILRTTQRIVLLLIFGVLLGLGFGWYFSGRITEPLSKLSQGAALLGAGDFSARVMIKTQDEVGMLATTFNKMAQDLQASTQALVYKERVAKELELAARMQSQIVPKVMPQISGLQLAAALVPAAEIGGDCYDVIKVDEKNHLLYLSDVTGHGVPSGIVVSIANALIYSYSGEKNLCDVLVNANRVLKQKTTQNMFMTLIMVRYCGDNQLTYVSAGHPEMMHYYGTEKKVVAERGGGIALGMVPNISQMVSEMKIPFNSGDCVILYSDGIPEGVNEKGEQYSPARLKRALVEAGELPSAEAIKNALIADVKEFMGKAPQMDDITLLVIRKI